MLVKWTLILKQKVYRLNPYTIEEAKYLKGSFLCIPRMSVCEYKLPTEASGMNIYNTKHFQHLL
jgi:hypothetical protein